ncbi:hypothetical protein QBC35DRAFT_375268 [Podospora australis]|uniref:C2H2-type domain-containing protein n=1 Tax=Podospora australis TaxID=1536484 RepID=A0AAN6X041_9PEZI|nr:hypothetical protein QBC35DRAFT_375268 [Podospora australis]
MPKHPCGVCKHEARTEAELLDHWTTEFLNGNGHHHCEKCKVLFSTPKGMAAHQRQVHQCPGCEQEFTTVAAVVAHIEKNQCKKITNERFTIYQEKKLDFSRKLSLLHDGADPSHLNNTVSVAGPTTYTDMPAPRKSIYDFADHFSRVGTTSLSVLRPAAGAGVRPDPVAYKVLSRDAPPVVRPTPQQLKAAYTPTMGQADLWPEWSPKHPLWNVKHYYVTFTQKYKCPVTRCNKGFPTGNGLRAHLLSAAHEVGAVKVQCPMCLKWFDSKTSLIQHTTSESVRCNMRHTEGHRHFLNQATAGMIDSVEYNEDGTPKYVITQEARDVFGAGKVAKEPETEETFEARNKPQKPAAPEKFW